MTAPIATFHTAYGVCVPLYPDPRGLSAAVTDAEGAMTIAGIYGDARDRCQAFLDALPTEDGWPPELLARFGGHPVLRLPLPPCRRAPLTTRLSPDARDAVNAVVLRVAAFEIWDERADYLLETLTHMAEDRARNGWEPNTFAIIAAALLTTVLDSLGETEIACLEAAAFHALSADRGRSRVALEWLRPIRLTWFADWRASHPAYAKVARDLSITIEDLPSWLWVGAA